MLSEAKSTATWGAAFFGLIAAGLWFWSTKTKILYDPEALDESGLYPAAIIDVDQKRGTKTDVLATAERQTYWSRWAALAAGAASALQAVALMLPDAN